MSLPYTWMEPDVGGYRPVRRDLHTTQVRAELENEVKKIQTAKKTIFVPLFDPDIFLKQLLITSFYGGRTILYFLVVT